MAGRYSVCYCSIDLPGVGYIDGIQPGIIEITEDRQVRLEGFTIGEAVFHSFNEDFEFETDQTFNDSINVNCITWHAREIKNWQVGRCNGNNLRILDDKYLEMKLEGVEKINGTSQLG